MTNIIKKQKILIVDDLQKNLFAMRTVLEDLDVDIVETTSGEEALWLVLKTDFAIIVLDVQMPEMDGFEIAKLLKENEKTKYVPIIFVTAINKDQSHVFKGYESGAVDYIFKPFKPEILKSKVQVFLTLGEQQDIAKKKTEQLKKKTLLLEEDRDKFVNILDTMGNGVCIINKDFEIQYANPIIETEFGKVEGQKCHKYFHEKETACHSCSNKQFDVEKTSRTELFF